MCIPALSVWNNDNDMRIVEVKYDDYALVHTIKTSGNTSEVLNNLFSESFVAQWLKANSMLNPGFSEDWRDWLIGCMFTGRNNETSADLQDMFSKFSTKTGILPENILILPKTVCYFYTDIYRHFWMNELWLVPTFTHRPVPVFRCSRMSPHLTSPRPSSYLHLQLSQVPGFHPTRDLLSSFSLWCLQHHKDSPETVTL